MTNLTQALVGWLIVMGMVFGGVGVLFFVMSAIRSLVLLTRRAPVSAPKTTTEIPSVKAPGTTSR